MEGDWSGFWGAPRLWGQWMEVLGEPPGGSGLWGVNWDKSPSHAKTCLCLFRWGGQIFVSLPSAFSQIGPAKPPAPRNTAYLLYSGMTQCVLFSGV